MCPFLSHKVFGWQTKACVLCLDRPWLYVSILFKCSHQNLIVVNNKIYIVWLHVGTNPWIGLGRNHWSLISNVHPCNQVYWATSIVKVVWYWYCHIYIGGTNLVFTPKWTLCGLMVLRTTLNGLKSFNIWTAVRFNFADFGI